MNVSPALPTAYCLQPFLLLLRLHLAVQHCSVLPLCCKPGAGPARELPLAPCVVQRMQIPMRASELYCASQIVSDLLHKPMKWQLVGVAADGPTLVSPCLGGWLRCEGPHGKRRH